MPPRKRRFVAITCEENEIEDTLETYWPDYLLTNLAAYGGIGFGIKAQVVLVLTLREEIKAHAPNVTAPTRTPESRDLHSSKLAQA